MYADDIILLSSTAESLQAKLDILDSYCNDWCLTVRERPFNLKGGYGFFSKKNILIPNVGEKKYSDFGGGKKK
jgi:hypothetical protein